MGSTGADCYVEAMPSATSVAAGRVSDVTAVQAALEPLWPAYNEAVHGTGEISAMTKGQCAVILAWVP